MWLDFKPQRGHEQAGRRPAVVLSPKAYNAKAGLLVCVPVTNQLKGYPFEVVLERRGRHRRGFGRSAQKPGLAGSQFRAQGQGGTGGTGGDQDKNSRSARAWLNLHLLLTRP
ncbi:MAG: type II toxin-antitoxin system PemK/MazF family toxin [Desulfobacterales bacterium]|nr:type II toxin-antitoxin system PemK/MazF family toxin [Desulfobacterales bacterium]